MCAVISKDLILDKIKQLAVDNGGRPPGKGKFKVETGIPESAWYGIHWVRWSQALLEAGFQANPTPSETAIPEQKIVVSLIEAIRFFGKWPTNAELRLYHSKFPDSVNHKKLSRFHKFKQERIKCVLDAMNREGQSQDIIAICESELAKLDTPSADDMLDQRRIKHGYVYLMKSLKYYKIGFSECAEKRRYELGIQLPEKLTLVHAIKTADPQGAERYWHGRFADKRKNGEWFALTQGDVAEFRRCKYM